jgi:prephenate dehydratase
MLAAEVDLKIKGEVVIAVRPCLLVKRGTDMKKILNIYFLIRSPWDSAGSS